MHALDRFIPGADFKTRQELLVDAPPATVFSAARSFELQSIAAVRGIFRLREVLLHAKHTDLPRKGLVDQMIDIGWGILLEEPGRLLIAGAVCQPWRADVVFRSVPADEFARYSEPFRVKIAWTLETVPCGPGSCRLVTETRAAGTDDRARAVFHRYHEMFGMGIVAIRWLVLRSVRRQAEQVVFSRQVRSATARDEFGTDQIEAIGHH